ncbi:SMP-30/gluconolactonase/LRE family protein [Alloalcanivorax xenomutans]|uniref:SMP-30/gluconolactonase/LRE family protein n=1 Tax=Alloalcanivorax xenomutans TaxID=1094342 RepID=A0A9Q3ZED1_9GAMM|nr:SMP-30/gluconolactonase/LRE family protein [Alloalcanivorax xenomutans]
MAKIAVGMALWALSMPALAEEWAPRDWVAEGTFPRGIEGPVVAPDGRLLVVNYQRPGTLGVISGRFQAALFLTLPRGSVASGLRFGPDGFLYAADHRGHNLLRIDLRDKSVRIWVHEPSMHQPNDLTIAADGGIYASDPDWKSGTGRVWYVSPAGRARIVAGDLGTTNGITLSPNGGQLYVNETVQRRIRVFDVSADGSLGNGRVLIEFPDHKLDGMRADVDGNLYVARYGAGEVAVVSPLGEVRRVVALSGKHPTNLAFGGEDGRRVFVTVDKRGLVESFRVPRPGADWARLQSWR